MQITVESVGENFENCLFYDIEVFSHNSLVVFKDINKNTIAVVTNDDFSTIKDIIQDKILIGYNNYYYDDYILTKMIENVPQSKIKSENDWIINGHNPEFAVNPIINSLDCFQQISVARSSLKKIEANMGKAIVESAIDFDVDRPLTNEELQEVIDYCKYDVDSTIDIFKIRWNSYFIPKLNTIQRLDTSKREDLKDIALKWNTTTIAAQVITGGKKITKKYKPVICKDSRLQDHFYSKVPSDVKDMWLNPAIKSNKCTVDTMNCVFEFGLGGLHGVNKYRNYFDNVKLLDVASMYPNIMINNPNVLGHATEKYKEIVEERIRVKHSDPILSNALKLIINSAYGLLKNQYSILYHKSGSLAVCIFGQIALFDLCTRLDEAGYTLVNINTDGVAFTGSGKDYEQIQKEWEEEYGLTLELSEFKRWIQKDVNNYIAETDNGYIKVKGKDVNKYHDLKDFDVDLLKVNPGLTWNTTNSLQIISICVVNKVLYNKEPLDTILENLNNPILFQIILQAGRTYQGTFDNEDNEYQKVNRIFATKKGVQLFKKREDGHLDRFPDTPEIMTVWNKDVKEYKNFSKEIDINFYLKLAHTVIERWKELKM